MIDEHKAIDLLRTVVEREGSGYIYTRIVPGDGLGAGHCVYFLDTGEPSCLIGKAFVEAGYDRSDLFLSTGFVGGDLPADALPPLNKHILTWRAADIFRAAQKMQDAGFSWGVALDEAEREYKK